jgi:hypothetical protein
MKIMSLTVAWLLILTGSAMNCHHGIARRFDPVYFTPAQLMALDFDGSDCGVNVDEQV